MSVHSIGGPGLFGSAYQSLMRSLDRAADATPTSSANNATGSGATSGGASGASAAPPAGAGLLSGANMIGALGGWNEEVTDAVTATLPNGITLGIYHFAPRGSDQGQAASSDGSSAGAGGASDGSSAAAGHGADYAAMAAALEQMVDQFMKASSAYQQGASSGSTQGGATGTVA